MNDLAEAAQSERTAPAPEMAPRRSLSIAWLILPIALFVAAVAWLYAADPLRNFNLGAPPVENLTFERTILDEAGVHVLVRAGGSEPMVLAQVQIDDAYWTFTQRPAGPIARGATAWVDVPFPWVLGEAHLIKIVTNTGATFEHEIAVAVPTPQLNAGQLQLQALVGIFVGIVPVAIGLLFFPALRGVGMRGLQFLLALTVGLLVFLLVDTFEEALDIAGQAAPLFQGPVLVFMVALASFLLLFAVGRRGGRPTGIALAVFLALGIGLHNLGEGLAIGAAFAAGAAGLGTFLVLGFTLHNITEGIGIAAPMLRIRPPFIAFVGLTLLAGGPAVIGMWVGSLAAAPQWAALALAIGAGAILQVVVEIGDYLRREGAGPSGALLSLPVLSGFAVGVALMYATAVLVKI
jgi:ZIP family zinc transporter